MARARPCPRASRRSLPALKTLGGPRGRASSLGTLPQHSLQQPSRPSSLQRSHLSSRGQPTSQAMEREVLNLALIGQLDPLEAQFETIHRTAIDLVPPPHSRAESAPERRNPLVQFREYPRQDLAPVIGVHSVGAGRCCVGWRMKMRSCVVLVGVSVPSAFPQGSAFVLLRLTSSSA